MRCKNRSNLTGATHRIIRQLVIELPMQRFASDETNFLYAS